MISEELIEGFNNALNGKEEGFNVVYNQTYSYVYGRCRMIMKNDDDAMELLQETYIAAYKSLDRLEDINNLYAWLGGIAYNQGMKMFRKRKDVLLDEDAEGLFDIQENVDVSLMPGEELEIQETAVIIKDILDELSEVQRAAVTAYYYDEMSVSQIAELMETTTGTIKSRLNYARKYIQKAVEEKEKTMGIKLHSTSIPSILIAVYLRAEDYSITEMAAKTIYEKICGSMGLGIIKNAIEQGDAAMHAIEKAGVKTTSDAAKAGTKAVSGIAKAGASSAGMTTTAKVLVGIAITLTLTAGGLGVYYYQKVKNEEETTTEYVADNTVVDATEDNNTEDNASELADTTESATTEEEEKGKVDITYENINEDVKADDGTILFKKVYEIPTVKISGYPDTEAKIAKWFNEREEEFLEGMDTAEEFLKRSYEGSEDWLEGIGEVDYTEARVDERVISFSRYHHQGNLIARSYVEITGVSFDPVTGNVLTLEDIATDKALFLSIACNIMNKECTEGQYKDIVYEDVSFTENDIEDYMNDGCWYFNDKGIVIDIGQGMISYDASGVIEFTIPYEDLQGIKEEYCNYKGNTYNINPDKN